MFGQMVERHDGESPRAVMLLPALGAYGTIRVPVGVEEGGPGERALVPHAADVVLDPMEAVRLAFALLARVKGQPVCRVCGCSDACACPGGCYWHAPDECSVCAAKRVDGLFSVERVCRDVDCPACEFPETYTELDDGVPSAFGCNHCDWREPVGQAATS